MNIEFKCPQCGQMVSADESARGQVAECPFCGKGIVVPRRKPKLQVQRSTMEIPLNDHLPIGVSSKSQAEPTEVTFLSLPSEKQCLKVYVSYWTLRLLIVFSISFFVGFIFGFVEKITGKTPFLESPTNEISSLLAHVGVFLALIVGVCGVWMLSWFCYKRFVIQRLFTRGKACNLMSSWFLPILIGIVINILMPLDVLLPVLGTYGSIVWSLTIWVVLDYGMFRFISIPMLCGQSAKLNPGWVCAFSLFCMLITIMFGFGRMKSSMEANMNLICVYMKNMDDSCHHDASQIYDRMKSMDDSRHHDTSQIYDRMKSMDDSRHHDAGQIYDRMGRMKLY